MDEFRRLGEEIYTEEWAECHRTLHVPSSHSSLMDVDLPFLSFWKD